MLSMVWITVTVDLESTDLRMAALALCYAGVACAVAVMATLVGVAVHDVSVWFIYCGPLQHTRTCSKRWSELCKRRCIRRCKRAKPILIEESPPPSKTTSTPMRGSAKSSARRTPGRALRAGLRRVVHHRRANTVKYDPRGAQGDCGYQCLLRMKGERPTKANVQLLREKTALMIEQAAVRGEMVGSVYVPYALQEMGQDAAAYAASVRRNQWASVAELTMAAKALNISTTLYSKYGVEIINEDPSAVSTATVIVMKGAHYVVKVRSRQHKQYGTCDSKSDHVPRAGMNSQQQDQRDQPVIVYINPTTLYEPPRINVFTELTPQHDIRGATLVSSRPIYMRRLRSLIGALLSRRPDTLEMQDLEQNVIPDWAPIPNIVLAAGGEVDTLLHDRVTIHLPSSLEFEITYDVSHNHLQFLQRVSEVVNRPTVSFVLTTRTGETWIFPFDLPTTTHAYLQVVRAGMRRASRSRSISPTQPYRAWGSGSLVGRLLPEPDLMMDEPRAMQDDSRDSTPPPRTGEVLTPGLQAPRVQQDEDHSPRPNIDDDEMPAFDYAEDEDTETSIAVWLHPGDFPPAQANLQRRPIKEGTQELASIWSPGRVRIKDVIFYLNNKLMPASTFVPEPLHAEFWEEVDHLKAPQRIEFTGHLVTDLRIGVWEPFQAARVIPLLKRDLIMLRYVLPRHLPPHIVQSRVAQTADYDEILTLVTVADNWVVLYQELPEHIREIVQETHPRPRYQRAGGKKTAQAQARPDPRQACVAWSLQRAEECLPNANHLTLAMLFKAEFRLAAAVMQCRSDQQVRHAVCAAYRRAGLADPGLHDKPQEGMDDTQEHGAVATSPSMEETRYWLAQMASTLTSQTGIISELLSSQHQMVTKVEMEEFKKMVSDHLEQHTQAIHKMIDEMKAVNERFQSWETSFLPTILDRLPPDPPPSPASSSPSSSAKVRQGPYERPSETVRSPSQPKQYEDQGGGQQPGPGVCQEDQQEVTCPTIAALQQASLKAQCAKVVTATSHS